MNRMLTSLLMIIFLLLSCDTEKYFSYNYDAREFSEIASFSGTVTNVFTGAKVPGAIIRIEDQNTVTDMQGFYRLDYVLSADAKLSKQIDIEVVAFNYLPYTQTQSIFPGDFSLDVELEYGAPIIEETGCYDMTFCQAIVFDYQGANNIQTVSAHFQYIGENNLVTHEFDIELAQIRIVTPERAHYLAIVDPSSPIYGTLSRSYTVTAMDQEGFSHTILHKNDEKNPDPLIFPLDSTLTTY